MLTSKDIEDLEIADRVLTKISHEISSSGKDSVLIHHPEDGELIISQSEILRGAVMAHYLMYIKDFVDHC